jgi:hypothetical protein
MRWWFDLLSAALWFALALVGVVLRCRRIVRLHRIVLLAPVHPLDREYLDSVKRSTYLRLGVKMVFLIGAVIALFPSLSFLWPAWRLGVVLALGCMVAETVSVDLIRNRLARVQEAP